MKNSEKVKRWRKHTKEKIVLAMGNKCQICGYNKCYSALCLHHIDPTKKEFSFGSIRANPRSISFLVEELKKCILLCANCHAEVHDNLHVLSIDDVSLNETILFAKRKKCKQKGCSNTFLNMCSTDFCSPSCKSRYSVLRC